MDYHKTGYKFLIWIMFVLYLISNRCNSIQTIALFGISLILIAHYKENFGDTEGVIRSRKSKKERQYNGPKKMDKRWTCHCVFATTLSLEIASLVDGKRNYRSYRSYRSYRGYRNNRSYGTHSTYYYNDDSNVLSTVGTLAIVFGALIGLVIFHVGCAYFCKLIRGTCKKCTSGQVITTNQPTVSTITA